MSPHAVNNFVSDLVLMAQAMEQLPEVKAELEQANTYIMQLRQTVQDRELRIIDLKTEAESLHASIRELEVAKDQAETMFLEADERTNRALDFIKATFGNAGSLIQALEPPRVEPVVQTDLPKPGEFDGPFTESVVSEVKSIEPSYVEGSFSNPLPGTEPIHPMAGEPTQGQSEPDPISAPIQNSLVQEASGDVSDAESISTEPAPLGPYVGKRYRDVSSYCSINQWIAGGGLAEDYYYPFN